MEINAGKAPDGRDSVPEPSGEILQSIFDVARGHLTASEELAIK